MDLENLFAGRGQGDLDCNEVFTNRHEHVEAFEKRLLQHARNQTSLEHLQDFHRPARNLWVITGQGGFGKSALIRHLLRQVRENDAFGEDRAALLFNFGDPASHNVESLILRIRAGLADLPVRWSAFDLAFAVYWERKHPGQVLAGFPRSSRTRQDSESLRPGDAVTSVIDEALSSFGAVGAGYRAAKVVGRRIMESQAFARVKEDLSIFEPLILEPDPDRILPFLPLLLAYDLALHQEHHPSTVVIALDTFESVQSLPNEVGSLQDLVSRVVYLMPNALFLIGSREPIRWASEEFSHGLFYGGAHRWPDLVADAVAAQTDEEAANRHLSGFTEQYGREYLESRLTRLGRPALPSDIQQRILAAFDGSPHYLELSIEHFQQLELRGRQPEPEDFGRPFTELVLSVLRDLSPIERDLLRASALFTAFDAELLTAALPDVRARTIERFLARSFVQHDPSVWPAQRIHENLRRAVNACDHATEDGWTATERATVVVRVLEALARRALDEWLASGRQPLPSFDVGAGFLLALHASAEHGVIWPGLASQAHALRELGHWQVLRSLPTFDDYPIMRPFTALVRTAMNPTMSVADRSSSILELTREMKGAGGEELTAFSSFELGNLAFMAGDLDTAEKHFRAIPEETPIIGQSGLFGSAGTAMRRSNFPMVTDMMERAQQTTVDQARVADMLGHMELHNGRFSAAIQQFEFALEAARRASAPLWTARAQRHLALAAMWTRPDLAREVLDEARALNEDLGDEIGIGQCLMSEGLVLLADGDADAAIAALDRAEATHLAAGATFEMLPVAAVRVLAHRAQGDIAGAKRHAERIFVARASGAPLGPPVWSVVAGIWTGLEPPPGQETVQWIDPDGARIRWLEPLLLRT